RAVENRPGILPAAGTDQALGALNAGGSSRNGRRRGGRGNDEKTSHHASANENNAETWQPAPGLLRERIKAKGEPRMNKRQLIALWIGIGLIVLIGVFPPWI